MIYVPWLLAVLTGICFALLARKAGRNPLPWALTGGLIALVAGTIVLGLGQATNNPFSDQQLKAFQVRWVFEAALTIAVLGWVFTLPLHRQHLWVWRKVSGKASQRSAAAPQAEAKARMEAPKKASKA